MRVLDGGRRRLVQHAEHAKAGAVERFDREVALTRPGVGGNCDHHLERLVRLELEIRALEEQRLQAREVLRRELERRLIESELAQSIVGRTGADLALDRTHDGVRMHGESRRRFPAELETSGVAHGEPGNEFGEAMRRLEDGNRVAPARRRSDHGARRPEIDAESHASELGPHFAPAAASRPNPRAS